ncbi:MAG: hypothetical protein IPJ51_21315 [Saprospiraceae bacterium]|nr:hypothetical protein [Saprospiraceae bacterium]
MVTFTHILKSSHKPILFSTDMVFQWAIARMVTLVSINIMLATHPAIGGFLRLKHCRTSPYGIAQSGMSPGWSLSHTYPSYSAPIWCFSGLSPGWSLSP